MLIFSIPFVSAIAHAKVDFPLPGMPRILILMHIIVRQKLYSISISTVLHSNRARLASMTRIILVDDNDNEIGLKERDEIGPEDLCRGSALWITSSSGDILLTQRSLEKKHHPGKWSAAVAGTVDEGEDYDINILKETEEEIGITLSAKELRKGPKIRMPRFFMQWYYATVDLPLSAFTLQEGEVMDIRWVSPEEFERLIAEEPEIFVSNLPMWLPQVLDGQNAAV